VADFNAVFAVKLKMNSTGDDMNLSHLI